MVLGRWPIVLKVMELRYVAGLSAAGQGAGRGGLKPLPLWWGRG